MAPAAQIEAALAAIKTDESKILGLTIGSQKVTPGLHIPKADAKSPPELSFIGTPGTTYLVICLDLDPPFKSFAVLGPALHWIQPGLKSSDRAGKLAYTDSYICDYAGPGPPPVSGPHRYIFLLYEQPADFDLKKYAPPAGQKVGISKRVRYDLEAFEKEAGLGAVVAANYFESN